MHSAVTPQRLSAAALPLKTQPQLYSLGVQRRVEMGRERVCVRRRRFRVEEKGCEQLTRRWEANCSEAVEQGMRGGGETRGTPEARAGRVTHPAMSTLILRGVAIDQVEELNRLRRSTELSDLSLHEKVFISR